MLIMLTDNQPVPIICQ